MVKSFLFILLAMPLWANAHLKPTRFINVNGSNIAVYESSGDRGPGILLIHGNTSSANAWEQIMDSGFARRHHVVAFDLPGYGNSSNAPAYGVAPFIQVIAAVANQTGVADGVIVGWSLGGDLALQASGLLPNAKGYFLVGTAPLGAAPGLPSPFLTPAESYAGDAVNFGFVANLTPEQIREFVAAFFRPNYNDIPNFFYKDGLRTDPATRAAVLTAASGGDPAFQDEVAIVHNLAVPIALVVGEKDAFVRPEYLTQLAPQIPMLWDHEIKFVKKAGHAVQWERPNKFISLLRDFIRDLPPSVKVSSN